MGRPGRDLFLYAASYAWSLTLPSGAFSQGRGSLRFHSPATRARKAVEAWLKTLPPGGRLTLEVYRETEKRWAKCSMQIEVPA